VVAEVEQETSPLKDNQETHNLVMDKNMDIVEEEV